MVGNTGKCIQNQNWSATCGKRREDRGNQREKLGAGKTHRGNMNIVTHVAAATLLAFELNARACALRAACAHHAVQQAREGRQWLAHMAYGAIANPGGE